MGWATFGAIFSQPHLVALSLAFISANIKKVGRGGVTRREKYWLKTLFYVKGNSEWVDCNLTHTLYVNATGSTVFHRPTLHRPTIHRPTVHQPFIYRPTVHWQTVHRLFTTSTPCFIDRPVHRPIFPPNLVNLLAKEVMVFYETCRVCRNQGPMLWF
jgi:hypothetical protein